MKKLYQHRVFNMSDQPLDTTVDLSKVTAIQRGADGITIHMAGRKAIVIPEMPNVRTGHITSAEAYRDAVEAAYRDLMAAWTAYAEGQD